MLLKLKSAIYTILAVVAVLFTAYHMGGRAAKKSMEIKRRSDALARIRTTLDTRNDIEHEIQAKDGTAVADELRSDWLRK
ncbi:hypothetical protein L9H26_19220 [Morganella psychrotolerans]|uniref:Uncharacterized protein n=1 Tax=Morganella psychrotolerans TaxID=368603 RepID=A0A5M9QXX3_9GAMM|nr:hypothetical protein [Morganella psychrotolerans]KAA8713031.1 hypothetical protein F4V73_18120 [Morganella psychrotolerans]OBU01873.1 hypothetical protein AYY16_16790 [Morganella psychrotolerans]